MIVISSVCVWIVYYCLSLNHELELLIKYETKLGDFYDLFFF